VASHQTHILLELRQTDSKIIALESEIKALHKESQNILERLDVNQKALHTVEVKLEAAAKTHNHEEERLKEEERKILERRKALSTIGGNKSAKLAQRELDIAKRIVETLETNVLNALGILEDLQKKRAALVAIVDELKELSISKGAEAEAKAKEEEDEVISLKAKRQAALDSLDPILASLYKRVEGRYRGDAIAETEASSCKTCFRALPNQTYNQVLAGYNLMQCPGCSRILVHIAKPEAEAVTE
jgi:predicted  nucleic acid-binding Zn-ribbon protein